MAMGFIFDAFIIFVFVLFLWRGYKMGFFRSILDFCIMIVSSVCSWLVAPICAEFVYNNFARSIFKEILKGLVEQGKLPHIPGASGFGMLSSLTGSAMSAVEAMAHEISADELIGTLMSGNNGAQEDVLEKIVVAMTPWIMNILTVGVFLVVFALSFGILRAALNFLYKRPGIAMLRSFDSFLGMIFGIPKFMIFAFLIVMLVKIVPTMFLDSSLEDQISYGVNDTIIFKHVYHLGESVFEKYIGKY